jgi:hydrogenase expression/formation protein HypC
MTPDASVGDYVLVHTGYAISLMDPEEAQASLEAFAALAEIQAEMEREASGEVRATD